MHYAGLPCKMEKIKKIALKHKLLIIEDAAQAFGASIKKKYVGTYSKAAAFSFNPMKPLAGYGEGGIVVTNDKKIYKKVKILRHAGTLSDPKKIITNYCREISLNHKMDSLNASLILVSLKNFKDKTKIKENIFKVYRNFLSKKIRFQEYNSNIIHGKYVFPIIVNNRDKLKFFLNTKGIETKIFNLPLINETPVYFSRDSIKETPKAKKLSLNSLIIPSHEKLSSTQVDYVIKNINKFVNKNK